MPIDLNGMHRPFPLKEDRTRERAAKNGVCWEAALEDCDQHVTLARGFLNL
jgi:hypothetical protein